MNNPEMNSLDINQIKEYLPHRYPMLLVDRVLDWRSGEYLTAIKNVSINEDFFNGHFANKPVMPGVLMIEAMAQSAALLSFLTMNQKPSESGIVYFIGIDDARFKRPVVPGDQIRMHVEIVRCARGIWKYKTRATVDGQLAVEAALMCTMRNADDASLPAT